jgi:hypothetical protein
MLETLWAAARATMESLGYTGGAIFVGAVVGLFRLFRNGQPGKRRVVSRQFLSVVAHSALAVGYVFAFHLGASYVRVEYQTEPAIRYSLGGSTNVFDYYPVPFDRWAPITDFRDVTLEWTGEREAVAEGLVSFSVLGLGETRCRLRLVNVADGSVAGNPTDWISRPQPPPLTDRIDVPFTIVIPRSEGRMVYRLEITADQPNGGMVASGEILFSRLKP